MSGFQIKMFSWCFEQYSFSHNVIVLFWWLIIIILSGWVATWGNLKTQTTGQMLLIRNNVPLSILFLCAPITKSLVSQGKSRIYKFVCWENLSGEPAAGCWIIAGGWIQSQHCRWYFQITNLYPPSTQHTGLPLIYFPVTPISLCYTSITQNRRNCSSERNIIGKYGSVTCRAICPGVLAWRDTRPRHWPTKFYGKRVPTLTARHSRVSGAKVSQHRMARLINDGAATSSSLQLASSILSRSATELFKEVAPPCNGWSVHLLHRLADQ